jgi:two-component system NtrC family sensor kinase
MDSHTILIVDDEEYIAKSIRRSLMEEGYNVHVATNGTDGLKIMQEEDVSLVIADYRMPLMDGIEFFKKVMDGWQDTIRIILTAYDDVDLIMQAANEVGAYKVIRKPWKCEELNATVNEAIAYYRSIKD